MATKTNNNNKSTTATDEDVKLNSKSSLEQEILDLKAKLAEYDDDGSSAYQNFKTAINNQIKFYQSMIKKLKRQEIKEKNVVNDISLNYEANFKMATKTNNNKKTKSIKLVTINDSDKNNNDKKETEELTPSDILDDIQEIKKEMSDPQRRIAEFRSKIWLTSEISELTEKVNENNNIIMKHEKLLLMMEFAYKKERTKENKNLITNIKKVIKSHQQENGITSMVLTLYQGFLQKLD